MRIFAKNRLINCQKNIVAHSWDLCKIAFQVVKSFLRSVDCTEHYGSISFFILLQLLSLFSTTALFLLVGGSAYAYFLIHLNIPLLISHCGLCISRWVFVGRSEYINIISIFHCNSHSNIQLFLLKWLVAVPFLKSFPVFEP